MKALRDQVMIEQVEIDDQVKTESGLILTGQSANAGSIRWARVLSVGPEVTAVKEGEIIVPDWNKAQPTKHEGKLIAFIPEEHVLAVIEGDE